MNIYVKTYNEIKGLHCWKDAPQPVAFLRYPHLHVFHIITEFEVRDEDREIEILMKEKEIEDYLIKKYYKNGFCDFGGMSCEMIANEILRQFRANYCEVLEDGKGGAVVVR